MFGQVTGGLGGCCLTVDLSVLEAGWFDIGIRKKWKGRVGVELWGGEHGWYIYSRKEEYVVEGAVVDSVIICSSY